MYVGRIAVNEPAFFIELHPVDGEPLGVVDAAVHRQTGAAMHSTGRTASIDGHPVLALQRRPDDPRSTRDAYRGGVVVRRNSGNVARPSAGEQIEMMHQ